MTETNNNTTPETYFFTTLPDFVQNAVRTESMPSEVHADPNLVEPLIDAFIHVGNMLDQVKKHMFYGSDYDREKYPYTMLELVDLAQHSLEHAKKRIEYGMTKDEDIIDDNFQMIRIMHSVIGSATESVELVEALQRYLKVGEFDIVNFREEMSDSLWYVGIGVDAAEGDLQTLFEVVINKLRERFPDKFNKRDAENRNLNQERNILEGKK